MDKQTRKLIEHGLIVFRFSIWMTSISWNKSQHFIHQISEARDRLNPLPGRNTPEHLLQRCDLNLRLFLYNTNAKAIVIGIESLDPAVRKGKIFGSAASHLPSWFVIGVGRVWFIYRYWAFRVGFLIGTCFVWGDVLEVRSVCPRCFQVQSRLYLWYRKLNFELSSFENIWFWASEGIAFLLIFLLVNLLKPFNDGYFTGCRRQFGLRFVETALRTQ